MPVYPGARLSQPLPRLTPFLLASLDDHANTGIYSEVEEQMLVRLPVPLKPVVWVGDSLEVLRKFPGDVQWEMGHAIYQAQKGDKHESAKPLLGFGSGVLEVVTDYRGDTFRAVYTLPAGGGSRAASMFCTSSKRRPSGGSQLPGSKPS
jgi:hypothetical protein